MASSNEVALYAALYVDSLSAFMHCWGNRSNEWASCIATDKPTNKMMYTCSQLHEIESVELCFVEL